MTTDHVALITGASRGLGRALARSLTERGWQVVADARGVHALADVAAELPSAVTIAGSVTDPAHLDALATTVHGFGRLDLLVNNASELGPSPLPHVADLPLDALRDIYETNVVAPVALAQRLLPLLRDSHGTIVDISSDAAVDSYPGWAGYGSAKAALDQLTAILAAEEPGLHVYAVDPGDMRTDMHQRAFPGEDISDRPLPGDVVPSLLHLLDVAPPSGRYRAADWQCTTAGASR
jgi:NAD(P)-dependent dehydrogenase (short-subunit alcohol dehydrogenase family)